FANAGDREMEILARGIVIAAIGMFMAYFFLSAQYEKQLYLMLGALVALSAVSLRSRSRATPPVAVRKPRPHRTAGTQLPVVKYSFSISGGPRAPSGENADL